MLTVDINRQQVPVLIGSVSIDHNIEQRSVSRFTVYDENADYDFQFGNLVEMYWDGTKMFTGKIVSSSFKVHLDGSIEHMIDATDFHIVADRRYIVRAYENQSITGIVESLFEIYLRQEGLTIGNIEQGLDNVDALAFDYTMLSSVLNELAELSGCYWNIDENLRFYFEPRGTRFSNRTITPAISLYGTLDITNNSDKYRNRQIITKTQTLTNEKVERFVGDSETRTFTLGYDVSAKPKIELSSDNGATFTELTTSPKSADAQTQFYYSVGSPVITQDIGETTLTGTEILRVTYIGQYPITAVQTDAQAIQDTINREVIGSGIYENVEQKDIVQPLTVTNSFAQRLLSKFKTVGRVISFVTRQSGFRVGQLADVDAFSVQTQALISRVRIKFDDTYTPVYKITAFSGPEIKTWAQLFVDLKRDRSGNVSTATEGGVTIPFEFDRDWLETDNPNIFYNLLPSPTILPSNTLLPSSSYNDKLAIVEARDINGNPVARAAFTATTGTDTLTSIATFSGTDGVGQEVYSFAFYTGDNATLAFGTGILLDEQTQTTSTETGPWVRNSIYENWQITRIDRRWA